MAARYVVERRSTGKYHWSLLATNGRVVASSEAYETKRAALRGIESVRKNAQAPVEDRTETPAARPAPVPESAPEQRKRLARSTKSLGQYGQGIPV